MPEWSTYNLSDLILFTERTYYRQFELYNQDIWPLQIPALATGIAILMFICLRPLWHGRAIAILMTLAWVWVAWAYHHERFATINWIANWYAIAFAVEASLLCWFGVIRKQLVFTETRPVLKIAGLGVFVVALVILPFTTTLIRDWQQIELFAMAPDPTVLATLGLLLLAANKSWILFIIPISWCLISGATLWVLKSPTALTLPLIAIASLLLTLTTKRNIPGR